MTDNKDQQYFRFLCKPIPVSSCIKTDKTVDEQDVYSQMTRDELEQLGLVGMPIFLEHGHGVKIKEGEEDNEIIYPENKYALGYVVAKLISDDGSLMTINEIPPVSDEIAKTPEGLAYKALRKAVISLVDSGASTGVSFSHNTHSLYDKDTDLELLKRYPIELSVTGDPLRNGSAILTSYYSDVPYHPDESIIKSFDVYKSMSRSAIDKAAQEYNRVQKKLSEDKKNTIQEITPDAPVNTESNNTNLQMSGLNNNNAGAPPGSAASNPDIGTLMKMLEESRNRENRLTAELTSIKPVYEEHIKQQQQQQQQKKQTFINNSKQLTENAKNLMDFLLKLEQDKQMALDPNDKLVFEELNKQFPETIQKLPETMSSILLDSTATAPASSTTAATSSSSTGAPATMQTGRELSKDEIYNSFHDAFALMSPTISSFNAASKYINKFIEDYNKNRSDQVRNQAKSSIVNTATAAVPQPASFQKKQAPEFLDMDQMASRFSQRQQQLQASPDEIRRISELSNSRLY